MNELKDLEKKWSEINDLLEFIKELNAKNEALQNCCDIYKDKIIELDNFISKTTGGYEISFQYDGRKLSKIGVGNNTYSLDV